MKIVNYNHNYESFNKAFHHTLILQTLDWLKLSSGGLNAKLEFTRSSERYLKRFTSIIREELERVHFDRQRGTREGSLRSSERNSRWFTSIIREEFERVHFDHQRGTLEGSLWTSERNSRWFTSIIREELERVHFNHLRGTWEGSLRVSLWWSKWTLSSSSLMIKVNPL